LKKQSILLIDDDIEMLRRLTEVFLAADFAVHAAPDGLVGLRRFEMSPPDVVVTDILMPEREGLETIMAMKQARPAVKIIAMSGGGRIAAGDFLKLASALGADAVIAKPFRLADLLKLVEQILAPEGSGDVGRAA